MKNNNEKRKVVIFIHVNEPSKDTTADFKNQETSCIMRACRLGSHCKIAKIFYEIGPTHRREGRAVLDEAIKYCLDRNNNISVFVALDKCKICSNEVEFENIKKELEANWVTCITVAEGFSFIQKRGLIN